MERWRARDVGSRGRMHARVAPFVTRLRRDYNSVDDRGRSLRLRFEKKEKREAADCRRNDES